MKKNTFVLLFLLILCVGCDKDDDVVYFEIPSSATGSIGEDEIRLLITESTSDSLVFSVEFAGDKSKRVSVNWGDDNILHSYKPGKIVHRYKDTSREYIVTIKATGIKSFDYSHQESISKTRSLALGKCPSLESFSASTYENIYENFDLSQCPQFNGRIVLYAYTDKFNFNGLKNFTDIVFFNDRIMSRVEMEDMNFTNIRFGMTAGYMEDKTTEKIHIKNTRQDIGSIEISIYNTNRPILVENIILDIPLARHLYIGKIALNSPLDLSKIQYINTLRVFNSDYPSIKMPQNMEHAWLDNQSLPLSVNQKLESFDFSRCSDMISLTILNFSNLKTVNIQGLKKLKDISIDGSPHLEIIRDLPEHNTIKTRKATKGESIKDRPLTDAYTINLKANK